MSCASPWWHLGSWRRVRPVAIVSLLGMVAGILLIQERRDGRDVSSVASFMAYSGVNLPWLNYGWDLGANPWGGAPGGFQFNRQRLDADFAFLADRGVRVCRVFLFCDLRTGLARTPDGDISGFDPFVAGDMQVLLESAARHRLRLIPVLLDHTVADGVTEENGVQVGEHPEIVADPERRAQFLERALRPFLTQFGSHASILAWEVMNEPRFATAVEARDIDAFIHAAAAVIRAEAPGKPVTIGHYDRYHHGDYGGGAADLVQVHYYRRMAVYWRFDTPAKALSDQPVLFGEVEPVAVRQTLDTALRNGYAGVLFWSLNADDGYDFRAVANDFSTWIRDMKQSGASGVSGEASVDAQ